MSKKHITPATWHRIFDAIALERIPWAGRLGEPDFLGRIYDLGALPSTDSRYKTADRDFWQYRVLNPADWDDAWVLATIASS